MYFEEVEIMRQKETTNKTVTEVPAKTETKKTTEKVTETVKAEQKEADKAEEVAEVKESEAEVAATAAEPAKKTTAKKTAVKKTETKAAAKKEPAAKKTTSEKKSTVKVEPDMELFVQYHGKQIDEKSLVEKVMHDCKEQKIKVQDIKLYVKPEENACYYVANGNVAGKVDLY